MADVSKVSFLGSEVNIKDAAARTAMGVTLVDGFVQGKYINTGTSPVAVDTEETSSDLAYVKVSCSAGDRFTLSGTGKSAGRLWAFLDSSNAVITAAGSGATASGLVLTAPADAAMLVVNVRIDGAYTHSLVKGVSPASFPDARATVYPTGNTKDRAADILAALTDYGVCFLAPGDYYIGSTLSMPDDTRIFGAGRKSRLILTGTSDGLMIDCGSGCQIGSLWLHGGKDAAPENLNSSRYAVQVKQANGTDRKALQMSDCWITGFWGAGVVTDTNGFQSLESVQITNCRFSHCGRGVWFKEKGEFGLVSNCTFTDNRYGALLSGGNNYMSNCVLSRNYIGARIYGSGIANNSHGVIADCAIVHNTYRGVEIDTISAGYLLSGCHFARHYKEVQGGTDEVSDSELFTNSPGVTVTGCSFLSAIKLRFSGDNAAANFGGCMFAGSPTTVYTGLARSASFGCRKQNGDPIDLNYPRSLTQYKAIKGAITNSGKWSNVGSDGYESVFIHVAPGSTVHIKTNASATGYFGFMKSYATAVEDEDAAISEVSGYTSVVVATFQLTRDVTVPSDSWYLYVCLKYNNTDRSPAELVIDGYDLLAGEDLLTKNAVALVALLDS